MKYYLDTEFLEGTQKEKFPISLFRKNTPATIDLISIGIVAEDGREYYAISKDFNLKEAWNRHDVAEQTPFEKYHQFSGRKIYWMRENVLKPIWRELYQKGYGIIRQIEIMDGAYDSQFTYKSLKNLITKHGKSNNQIAEEVEGFCSIGTAYSTMDKSTATIMHFLEQNEETLNHIKQHDLKHVFNEIPTFYAYFADYDWVAFCWLFGKMMDLPKGFPMYTRDLKQMLDEKADSKNWYYGRDIWNNNHNRSSDLQDADRQATLKEKLEKIKRHVNYPKQTNEHNALADARWNKKLHEFLFML